MHVKSTVSQEQRALLTARRLLVAADACAHLLALRPPAINEDVALARRSLARLARERFETAVFGHGRAIMSGADLRFRKAFAAG